MPLVDVAISQRRAQGIINVVIETRQGAVKQRASVVTDKFLEPSAELLAVVEAAERDEKNMKRREARRVAKAREIEIAPPDDPPVLKLA